MTLDDAREPALALVLGDFGRDAALRFCLTLADAERDLIRARLGDTPFFDEHRLLTLTLVADLRYVKREPLARFRREGRPLDRRVLVGFPGGVALDDVVPLLGRLAFDALAGPLRRGLRRVIVLLPCNTLAPLSWRLERSFAARGPLQELLRRTAPCEGADAETVELLLERAELSFPTVPDAVLGRAEAGGIARLLPLGTGGVAEIYAAAARRRGSGVQILAPDPAAQRRVLRAIESRLSGETEAARRLLREVIAAAGELGTGTRAVEACTDLGLGVGLDSNRTYARQVVKGFYGAGDADLGG